MKLLPTLTTVTPLTKIIAILLFILFPLIGFYAGMEYQRLITPIKQPSNVQLPTPISPTHDEVISQVPTGTWKTYRNEEYGFEFEYPVTATVKESNNTNIVQLEYRDDNGKGAYGAWWWSIYIQTLNTMVSDDIEAWVTRNYLAGYEENEGITSIAKENATISGKESFRYEYINKPTGLKVTKIWINKNDTVLLIYFESFSGDSNYLSTFNQILSTFRFLDEE